MFKKYLDKIGQASIEAKTEYNLSFVMQTASKFASGSKFLGVNASSLIALQGAAISNKELNKALKSTKIDMEAIVDASVQGDVNTKALESQSTINSFFDMDVEFPEVLGVRVPKKIQESKNIKYTNKDMYSEFYDFMTKAIDEADRRILGEGAVSKGREKGTIDSVTVNPTPFLTYKAEMPSWLEFKGRKLLWDYQGKVNKLMEETADLPLIERLEARKATNEFRIDLIKGLNSFKPEEIKLIVALWAADCYSSERYVHDSHLWIENIGLEDGSVLTGTFEYFLELLQDIGICKRIDIAKTAGELFRVLMGTRKPIEKQIKTNEIDVTNIRKQIRVWRPKSEGAVSKNMFAVGDEIEVAANEVLANDVILKLGDRTPVASGTYKIIEVSEITGKDGKIITTGVNLLIDEA